MPGTATQQLDDGESPIGYLNFSWSYLRSAEHLWISRENGALEIAFPSPILFLAAQSYELLFKAYLRHKGLSSEQLRDRKLGHHLDKLFAKAHDLGIDFRPNNSERDAFDRLAKLHAGPDFEARYLKTGPGQSIDLSIIFGMARRLVDVLEPMLAAKRVKQQGLRTKLEPLPELHRHCNGITLEEAAEALSMIPELSQLLDKDPLQ